MARPLRTNVGRDRSQNVGFLSARAISASTPAKRAPRSALGACSRASASRARSSGSTAFEFSSALIDLDPSYAQARSSFRSSSEVLAEKLFEAFVRAVGADSDRTLLRAEDL